MKYGTRGTLRRPEKKAEDYSLEDIDSQLRKVVIWAIVAAVVVSAAFFKVFL